MLDGWLEMYDSTYFGDVLSFLSLGISSIPFNGYLEGGQIIYPNPYMETQFCFNWRMDSVSKELVTI